MAGNMRKWPDLVGKTGEEAKKIIEEEDAELEVIILPENSMVTRDLRIERVRIFINDAGLVATAPVTG